MRLARRLYSMSESTMNTIGLAVVMILLGASVFLLFGQDALDVIIAVTCICLILERSSIFRRIDAARDEADKALAASERADGHQRIDRELAELRGWMDALHTWLEETTEIEPEDEPEDEPDDGDLAWQPDPAPATQPIVMPAPAGPATEPADQVLIAHWAEDVPHPVDSDDRKAQHEAWVDETLARFDYSGRNR